MIVDNMVATWLTGFRKGVTLWPESWVASAVDQVAECAELTDAEVDDLLRIAFTAALARAARAEAARRAG